MRAAILLGADTGDAAATFAAARRMIEERAGRIEAASEVLTSRAWGFESATVFYNQALCVATELGPVELLDVLQGVERDCGRDREAEALEKARTGQRYASRRLDADILFCEESGDVEGESDGTGGGRGVIVDTERLRVPHPLVARRAFALRPLAQIAPALRHPLTGRTVAGMLADIENEERLQNETDS